MKHTESIMTFDWEIIHELTDRSVLGTDGISVKEPRRKSRAILINEDGKYAVMYEAKSDIHVLPGGAIEDGEDETSAIIREIFEETGCTCDTIEPLGIVSENRYHADVTSLSYFFIIHTNTKENVLHLTTEEIELGTILKWCTLNEVFHLIRDVDHETNQKRFLQARDLSALNEYIRKFNIFDIV
ncbi:MAG: NUDIX domain-containing protein [Clostridia bacterium]|nr:NUDIX domain-containing protein [Clostridia bacterium]